MHLFLIMNIFVLYVIVIFYGYAMKFINFDDYDILVELIGGDKGVAKEIVINALKKKKNVVK